MVKKWNKSGETLRFFLEEDGLIGESNNKNVREQRKISNNGSFHQSIIDRWARKAEKTLISLS